MKVLAKTIKNVAIAFGIFLAITIVNFCLDGVYYILKYANLIHNDNNLEAISYNLEKSS